LLGSGQGSAPIRKHIIPINPHNETSRQSREIGPAFHVTAGTIVSCPVPAITLAHSTPPP
jgi:hypothetical protein